MNLIKSIRSVVIAVLLCSSCSDDRHELMSEIKAVEDIINVRPDSALLLIEEIQSGHITGKAEKAKLSLLQFIQISYLLFQRVILFVFPVLQMFMCIFESRAFFIKKP